MRIVIELDRMIHGKKIYIIDSCEWGVETRLNKVITYRDKREAGVIASALNKLQELREIPIDDVSGDELECLCGNDTCSSGFGPCLADGTIVEPIIGGQWKDLYKCYECGQIYRDIS